MAERPSPREIAEAAKELRERLTTMGEDWAQDPSQSEVLERSLDDLQEALAELKRRHWKEQAPSGED